MKYKELLEKIQNALRDEKPSEVHHSYAQATALRVPKNLPKQVTSAKPAIRKTDIVTKEWNKEVQQASNCSSHIETTSTESNIPGVDLIPARVHRWNIKNYASIKRKMQMLVNPQEKELSTNISVISNPEVKNTKTQDELLFDMMKRREERQFRIEKPLC